MEEIINELKKLPDDIYDLKMEIFDTEESLNMTEEQINKINNDIMLGIISEVNDAGKPVFSNEQKRTIEFENRLSGNQQYEELIGNKDYYKSKLYQQKAELDRLYNVQNNYRVLATVLNPEDKMLEVNVGGTKI